MTTAPDANAVPIGLRERKKLRARRAIRDAALRLFAEHGYEAVSVAEQMPAARLQLNVAMAALMTAYEQWQPPEPFRDFIDAARANLAAAGAGFDSHPAPR